MAAAVVASAARRLASLRELLVRHRLNAYVVPTADAHNSEYVAECDKRREFLSGFTGSAGTAVVTSSSALLWTDGRYYAQALKELSSEWTLMKDRLPETPTIEQWLVDNLPRGSVVGVDPRTATAASAKAWRDRLAGGGVTLESVEDNLVDAVWADARPAKPHGRVIVHPIEFAGRTVEDKLAAVRKDMADAGAAALLVCALDEVAWLMNLRGCDVECNPVFFSYALVTASTCRLFVDGTKLGTDPADHLARSGVTVLPYDAIQDALSELIASEGAPRVWLDPAACNMALRSRVPDAQAIERASPVQLLKAVKNDAELRGIRAAHVRDGLAIVRLFAWIEAELESRATRADAPRLTECSVSDRAHLLRAQSPLFQFPSFTTIAGSGPNGAIIHYRPDPSTALDVTRDRVLLVDSGGQYLDGTTDITRTVHMGTPSEHERRCYTRVLQGHIALATAVFPENTFGTLLDTLARKPLWEDGLDYQHGTGHGVGCFLNVHEGPHGVSPQAGGMRVGLRAGMLVTDEPGYYETAVAGGSAGFGIRIENVLIVQEAATRHHFGGKRFLCFENPTLAPIDTNLIDATLLSDSERRWLNDYHERVRATHEPVLRDSIERLAAAPAASDSPVTLESERHALAWLLRATSPLA